MEQLSLPEYLHSKRNRLMLRLRQSLRFHRSAYRETGFSDTEKNARLKSLDAPARSLWQQTEERHSFSRFQECLSLPVYEKNLLTLWTLEQFFPTPPAGSVLEAGCQDFARLPALAAFFPDPVTGIELDPYPVMRGLHSRFDKASFYRSVADGISEYRGADAFRWCRKTDLFLAFYPFVSPHPALAWGLPAEYGRAEQWLSAIDRVLRPGGVALLVHQGNWEQEEFDLARNDFPQVELVKRLVADCPFSPQPYPPHASLYRKARPC